jgi:glycosyltransferase involved in cell wall biosynthesis
MTTAEGAPTSPAEPRQPTGPKVLRIYHAGVVAEYRERDRQLRRFGFDLHLASPRRWEETAQTVSLEPELSDLPVHLLPIHGSESKPNLFWYGARALRRLLLELQPDIVDLHEEPFSLAVAAALPVIRRYAPRAAICIYTAQNLPKVYPPPFSWFETRALAQVTRAYPCSVEAGQRLRSRGFTGGLDVIPLGVNLPDSPRPAPEGNVIAFVGRLEPYKGAKLAINAFTRLASRTDTRLVIVGTGSEELALRNAARDSGWGDRIEFTGALSQEETLERMTSFDVLLVPSLTTPTWKEQFGRVAAQGLAAGCVVIASDSGSLPDGVGDAGILVPEGDAEAIADAVDTVLTNLPERARLIRRARSKAQEFTWTSVAARMADMYEQAIESTSGSPSAPQLGSGSGLSPRPGSNADDPETALPTP